MEKKETKTLFILISDNLRFGFMFLKSIQRFSYITNRRGRVGWKESSLTKWTLLNGDQRTFPVRFGAIHETCLFWGRY